MALGTCAVDCTRREQRCGQPCVHAEFQRTRRLNSKPAATSSASSCRALPGKSRRRNFEHGFDHGPFQRMATTRQSGNLTRVRGELKPSKKAQAERWPLQQPVIIALSFLLNRQVWEASSPAAASAAREYPNSSGAAKSIHSSSSK